MPFDWTDFLTLAEDLATKLDEASKRTAISRAYYFVYNIAFARAKVSAGSVPGEYGYHRWCWEKYRNTPDPACRQLGIDGQRMHDRRCRADYEKTTSLRLNDEVQRMLQDAREFQRAFQTIPIRYPLP
jgi:predicted DNA-binding protein